MTSRWLIRRAVLAVAAGSAVMVPSVLVEVAEDRGGIGEVDNLELLALSVVFAVVAASLAAVTSSGPRTSPPAASKNAMRSSASTSTCLGRVPAMTGC